MGIHNTALIGASSQGYQISRSVRLRSSASAYLNRTPASATNRKTWTWSAWVKRGTLGASSGLFQASPVVSNQTAFTISSSNTIFLQDYSAASSYNLVWESSAVFRDPSAWYHIVGVFDVTQASSANAVKLYVNGVQQTLVFTAYTGAYVQNRDGYINSNIAHNIGLYSVSEYFDGYLTEINFIDGQALTPSSFGETNAVTGVWQPKKYSGTYGTNGFDLDFSDNSAATAAAIGKDYSGNGNNWTPNNISVTAGVTYDSMLDTPTPFADGSTGRGNYAVLNPLSLGSTVTLSNGNLTMTEVGTYATTVSSIGVTSGKWYAEMTVGSNTYAGTCGIARLGYSPTSRLGFQANTWAYNSDGGLYYNSTQLTPTQATFTTGDVIGIELDIDNLTIKFYKNNTLQTQFYTAANSGLTAGEFYFATGHINSTSNWNFGQRPFTYTPPTGFKALNTQNLPAPTISNGALHMASNLWTANVASPTTGQKSIAVGFQPDLVWSKNRSDAEAHYWVDSVRGDNSGSKWLRSNSTAAEGTDAVGSSTAKYVFSSTGFDIIDTDSTAGEVYYTPTSRTYVGWAWKAGGTAVTNTSGTISSQVSANPTAGFSIVTYTGTGANATVGHGLGVAPSMVIVKSISTVTSWSVYHQSIGAGNELILNSTAASAAAVNSWNSTAPTSSVFSVGTAGSTNTSPRTYVAYCFAAVAGYSAFGSYTGNGSADGPFVYLGFRPRFILIKASSNSTASTVWTIIDTSRNPNNASLKELYANAITAEGTDSDVIDIMSNGFKPKRNSEYANFSTWTYVYMAFAENPFKYANAR